MAPYFPIIALTFVLIFLVWLSRKTLLPLIVALMKGQWPTIWFSGARQNKCPNCGALVDMNPGPPRKGETVFRCPSCGDEGTWT